MKRTRETPPCNEKQQEISNKRKANKESQGTVKKKRWREEFTKLVQMPVSVLVTP